MKLKSILRKRLRGDVSRSGACATARRIGFFDCVGCALRGSLPLFDSAINLRREIAVFVVTPKTS
jgi:hypothetical protein